MRLIERHGHHHTFASGQAIGLHHNRRAFFVHISMGCKRIGKSFIVSCWNTVALHEGLGKRFGALQLRCRFGRAKNTQAVRAKFINDACGQRLFWPDHCQRDFLCDGPSAQLLNIGDVDVLQPPVQRRTAIAGRYIHRLHF